MQKVLVIFLLLIIGSCRSNLMRESRLLSPSHTSRVQPLVSTNLDVRGLDDVPKELLMQLNVEPWTAATQPQANVQYIMELPKEWSLQPWYTQVPKFELDKRSTLKNILLREKIDPKELEVWTGAINNNFQSTTPKTITYTKPWIPNNIQEMINSYSTLPTQETMFKNYNVKNNVVTPSLETIELQIGLNNMKNQSSPQFLSGNLMTRGEWEMPINALNAFKSLNINQVPKLSKTLDASKLWTADTEGKTNLWNHKNSHGYEFNVNHIYKDGAKAISYSSVSYGAK